MYIPRWGEHAKRELWNTIKQAYSEDAAAIGRRHWDSYLNCQPHHTAMLETALSRVRRLKAESPEWDDMGAEQYLEEGLRWWASQEPHV